MSMKRGVEKYEGNGNGGRMADEERGTICTTKYDIHKLCDYTTNKIMI